MAIFSFKGLLVVGVLVAFAAFYARPVFPDTASNRGLKTFIGLTNKFIGLVGYAGGLLDFSPLNITRSLVTAVTLLNKNSDTVERYTTTMDGVEVVIFKPSGQPDGLRPGIVFYHGGGWILMSPDAYAAYCTEIVQETQSILVSVNYRLAPEHIYPVPLEDCLTATRYFLRNAQNYGVDGNRVGVKGDSAGGNLAMAVTLKLSKEPGLPSLKFMSLIYPALQVYDFNLPCYQKYESGPGLLTKNVMIKYWLLYAFGHLQYYEMLYTNQHITNDLKDSQYGQYVSKELLPATMRNYSQSTTGRKTKAESNNKQNIPEELTKIIIDPLFAPLMATDEDLKLLPPTYLVNVEFDVLRDEGLIAAHRLESVGVNVTKIFLSSEEHGYFYFVQLDSSVGQEITRFALFLNATLNHVNH